MKITRIETIHLKQFAAATWVRVHTDSGYIGLGETWFGPRSVANAVHEMFSPLLIGQEASAIERHWRDMFDMANAYGYAGAEARAISQRNEDRSVMPLVESDAEVLASVQQDHDETLAYVRRAVGKTDANLHSYFALVADDPSVQVVSNAQRGFAVRLRRSNVRCCVIHQKTSFS